MSLTLTERASQHVKKYLAAEQSAEALRVSVKTTGCSGYAYVVETADKIAAEDKQFESNGVKIVVDPESFDFLKGTELDYVREGINEGFRFKNPNVAETCGCGESFTIDPV